MSIYIKDERTDEPLLRGYKKGKAIVLDNISAEPFTVRFFIEMDEKTMSGLKREMMHDVDAYLANKKIAD